MSNRWKSLIYCNIALLVPSVAAALLSLSILQDYADSLYHLATFSLGICFCIDIFPLSFGVPARHDSKEYARTYWTFFATAAITLMAQVSIIWFLTNKMSGDL